MASRIVVNLDTSKENYLLEKCIQYDDITLEANIFENGVKKNLANHTVIISVLKPDGTFVIETVEATGIVENKITKLMNEQTTTSYGIGKVMITLTDAQKLQNSTFEFKLDIKKFTTEGAVASAIAVPIVKELTDKVAEAIKAKNDTDALIQGGNAATKAELNAKPNGVSVYTGSNDNPNVNVGKAGDLYINTTNNNCYVKSAQNTWDKKGVIPTDIIDNLTSTEINSALSARQGKVLNEKILVDNLKYVATANASINFIGDSITRGHSVNPGEKNFVTLFTEKVREYYTEQQIAVNNFGVDGKKASDFLTIAEVNRIMGAVNARSARNNIFIISLGTNEIYSDLYETPLQYKNNLKKLIKIYSNNNKNKVILAVPIQCTVPPKDYLFYSFRERVYELAGEYGLTVVDYSLNDMSIYLGDGIHPNAEGHKVMYNQLFEKFCDTNINYVNKVISFYVSNNKIRHYYNNDYNLPYEIDWVADKFGEMLIGDQGVTSWGNSIAGTSDTDKARKFANNSYLIMEDVYLSENFTISFVLADKGTGNNEYLFSSFVPVDTQCGLALFVSGTDGGLYVYPENVVGNEAKLICPYADIPVGAKVTLSITNGTDVVLYVNGVAKPKVTIPKFKDRGAIIFGDGASFPGSRDEGYRFTGAFNDIIIADLLTDSEVTTIHDNITV